MFLGKEFWSKSGVYDLLAKMGTHLSIELCHIAISNTPGEKDNSYFVKDLLLTDSIEEIIVLLVEHATRKNLPLNTCD